MRGFAWACGLIMGMMICYFLVPIEGARSLAANIEQQEDTSSAMSIYLGFLAVMLTAVTVVLASVAAGIGFFAVFTRREIKKAAQKMAEKTVADAEKTVADLLEEKLSDQAIQDRIDEVAFRGVSKSNMGELEEDFDQNDSSER